MAQSLYVIAKNLQGRIDGVAQDAKSAKLQAQGRGTDTRYSEEIRMAAQIIIDAAAKANTYLNKVKI